MSKSNKIEALIVGSDNHPLAEKCVSWGDDGFYIGDYKIVIFYLPSLNKEKLDDIAKNKKHYFHNLRQSLVEAQEKGDLAIFCILEKYIKSNYDLNGKIIFNYSWCPIIPLLEETAGQKIPQQTKKSKLKYLDAIKGWDVLLKSYANNTGYKNGSEWVYSFKMGSKDYLHNNFEKSIAFGLEWEITQNGYSQIGSRNPMVFLPKLNSNTEAIDVILSDFILEEDLAPEWISSVNIFGQKNTNKKISKIRKEIEKLRKEKNTLTQENNERLEFKKLLYLQGKPLEGIVTKSLNFLGINLKSLDVENLEDRIFKYENFSIPFEIRGKDSKGLNEEDLSQLIKRIADRPKGEKYKTKGVFVLNHYRKKPPKDRPEVCHFNIIEKAKAFDICILTTTEIFELVNRVLAGESINIEEQLFNAVGLFKYQN